MPPTIRVPEAPAAEEKLGIAFEPLTEELAQLMGYDEAGGVVITSTQPLGPASRRGVRRGEKILEINGQSVETPRGVNRLLKEVDAGEVVALRLGFLDGSTRTVTVRAGG